MQCTILGLHPLLFKIVSRVTYQYGLRWWSHSLGSGHRSRNCEGCAWKGCSLGSAHVVGSCSPWPWWRPLLMRCESPTSLSWSMPTTPWNHWYRNSLFHNSLTLYEVNRFLTARGRWKYLSVHMLLGRRVSNHRTATSWGVGEFWGQARMSETRVAQTPVGQTRMWKTHMRETRVGQLAGDLGGQGVGQELRGVDERRRGHGISAELVRRAHYQLADIIAVIPLIIGMVHVLCQSFLRI